MSVLKTFNIALDTKKALYGDRITLVESDTGNRFVITLTDDGDPVNLTGCRVAVVFSGAMGTAMQTSWSGTGQVTIGGDDDNEITVDVLPASYANGLVTCEIQVYSGESYTTLVTSAAFTFNGRKPIVDENTLDSSTEYPILVELINQVEGLTTREQSDWEQTDGTQGNYIQNKPVVGTDYQDATQNLTAEATLSGADTVPFYDASESAHRKSTWANIVSKIRTALFGSITGLLKLDGAGNASAGVANTDYAAATHASRHSVAGADALSGYATVDANSKVTATQASAYVNTKTDSYTLVLGDAGGRVHMNKATANNLTVPPNSSVAFPVGTEIEIKQIGAGQTTIVAGSGVTLRNADAALKIEKQWCSASLIKLATDEWCVDGRTVA